MELKTVTTVHLGYEYYTWSIRDDLPDIAINDKVALKPHDGRDFRGILIAKYFPDGCETMRGIVRMDSDGREKHVDFVSQDIRFVYRSKVATELLKKVLIVSETIDYRSCARSQIFSTDFVVEIGSSFGESSVILHKYARKLTGFDISSECVDACKTMLPDVEFFCADCYQDSTFIIEQSSGCNVVFIDIGGNRCIRDQLEVLQWVQVNLQPELIVQKSRKLFEVASAYGQEMHTRSGVDPLPFIETWMTKITLEFSDGCLKKEKAKLKRTAKRGQRSTPSSVIEETRSTDCENLNGVNIEADVAVAPTAAIEIES